MKLASKTFNWGFPFQQFVVPPGVKQVWVQATPNPQARLWDCGNNHMIAYAQTVRTTAQNAQYIPVGWGANQVGQLADGTINNRSTPTVITTTDFNNSQFKDLVQVEAANDNTIIRTHNGINNWSSGNAGPVNNLNANLENNNIVRSSPVLMNGQAGMIRRKGAINNGYLMDLVGNISSWGDNSAGQIGDGTTTTRSLSTQLVTGVTGTYEQIFPMAAGFFGKRATGETYCWGDNTSGQLGIGSTQSKSTPTLFQAASVSNWKKIVGGIDVTLGLKYDGTVWGWGGNAALLGSSGQATASTPIQIPSLNNIIDLECNFNNSAMALKVDGTLFGWGSNSSGELGGIGTFVTNPAVIVSNPLIIQLGLGGSFGAFLTSDGNLFTSGVNTGGQLGNGNTTSRSSFAVVNNTITMGGQPIQLRFIKEMYRPGLLPVPVVPGAGITVSTSVGTVTVGGSVIYNYYGLNQNVPLGNGLKIFWWE